MSETRFGVGHPRHRLSPTRRTAVGALFGGVAGALGLASYLEGAESVLGNSADARIAAAPEATPLEVSPSSTGLPVSGDQQNLQELLPGSLVEVVEITPTDDGNFPQGARAWRVIYVSTGRDNSERTLVSGIVVCPDDLANFNVVDKRGRLVSWTHGTLGVTQRCQPSETPGLEIWGATPYGINQVAWGSEASGDYHAGEPQEGMLAGMMENGWIVTATDYASEYSTTSLLQPYAIGKIEAANAIDNLRAAHHLLGHVYGDLPFSSYDVVTWGHSQGGHAAMWTGQLLEEYVAATKGESDPALSLSGVVSEAPASNFLTDPAVQGEDALGFSMFDWLVHTKLQLTGQSETISLAPFIMSYLMGTWTEFALGGAPDPNQMPAFPVEGTLALESILPDASIETVQQMTQVCWVDGEAVAELVAPYSDSPFLLSEVSDGEVVDGFQHGNFDRYFSSSDVDSQLAVWRSWILYSNPGPLGVHPFSKLPLRDGMPVPVLISAGSNDGVVHCVSPDPDRLPTAREGAPVALFDALRSVYEKDGEVAAHLSLLIWKPEDGVTTADHSDITGLIGAAGANELRFHGSPLESFMKGAFEGTLPAEVTANIVNS